MIATIAQRARCAPATAAGGAPPGEDEPADPGSGYVWAADFSEAAVTDYNNTVYPSVWVNSVNNGALAVVAGRTGNAIQVTVPEGGEFNIPLFTPSPGSVVFGDATMTGAGFAAYGGLDGLVAQFYFKATGTINAGCKWFEMWGDDGAFRVQFSISGDLWRLGPNGCGSNGWGSPSSIGEQPVAPFPEDCFDNTWRRCTILLKPNTTGTEGDMGSYSPSTIPESSRDGRAAMWIDGTKIMDVSQATVDVTPAGGSHSWCTQAMVDTIPTSTRQYAKFPDVFNNPAEAFVIAYDDIKFWVPA